MEHADAEAFQNKCAQREEKGENKESGRRGYTNQGSAEWRKRVRIKTANAEAIQVIKGPKKEEMDENKESGCRGYTNQGRAKRGEGRA